MNVPEDPKRLLRWVLDLRDRVTALERRQTADETAPAATPAGETQVDYLAVLPGALSVSTSPPWTPRTSGTFGTFVVLLGTAGTSSTVVEFKVNGTTTDTFTITSGTTVYTASSTTAVRSVTDIVTTAVTTVGTGAADLTVEGWFA